MEIEISRKTLKKAIGIFVVIALFFGMCSPALPFLPKVSFEAVAIYVTDAEVVSSGNCGWDTSFEFYDNGTLVISGNGEIRGDGHYWASRFEEFNPQLKKIIIEDGITGIGEFSFHALNIESVEIPASVTRIGHSAFSRCTNLKSIEIPDSVVELGEFDGMLGGYAGDIFGNCTSLESVKLPKNLKVIPGCCFDGCTSLKSIEIPDSVTEIENAAFLDCSGLEDIKLPGTLKVIPSSLFCGCTSLKSIEIPYGVTEIQDFAFKDCSSLKSIELPDGVTKIDVCAFENCINLETVKFNEGLEIIEESAFRSCYLLKAADLPSTVKTINRNAFYNCIHLNEVTIPESVTSVGEGLFNNCIRLSKVNIMNPDCEILYDRGTLPETAVIYGYSGSTAEKYATDWLRKFVPLDKEHDHEFESKVTLKPTCTSTGVETYTCYCGETRTEVIPANTHYDIDKNDLCDMCGTKLNTGGNDVTPDAGEEDNTTEAPEDNNNDNIQEPEEAKSAFEKFFESIANFFKNLMNIFNFFK